MDLSYEQLWHWSDILSPLLVGVFTLIGAWIATTRAHKLDRDHRAETSKEEAEQFIRAIRAELQVARERYMEAVGRDLEKQQEGTAFTGIFRASQSYLSVYENSGHILGIVNDSDTVEKIVRAYTYLRSLIDTYENNNELVNRYGLLQGKNNSEEQRALAQLGAYRETLQQVHNDAIHAIDDAQLAIKAYLNEPASTIV